MSTYEWIARSGDWDAGGNWGPVGPPGGSDQALIDNGVGGTITLSGNVSDVQFSHGGNWTLTGGMLDVTDRTPADEFYGRYSVDIEDFVVVDGGTLASNGAIDVGYLTRDEAVL